MQVTQKRKFRSEYEWKEEVFDCINMAVNPAAVKEMLVYFLYMIFQKRLRKLYITQLL